LFGKNDRRIAYAVAMSFLAAVFAFPTFAAAEAVEEEAVIKKPVVSPHWPWDHWTTEEIEEAIPLPLVTFPESPGAEPGAEGGEGPASTAAVRHTTKVEGVEGYKEAEVTGAVEGIEVAADETTTFPNNVSGLLAGEFQWSSEGKKLRQKFTCSASVVSSPRGNVIVTAGHCAIDPNTGAEINTNTVFIPAYRKGVRPYGEFKVSAFATPKSWEASAKPESRANEGADIAFMELWENEDGETVEEAVGASMGIEFDQSCNHTYTQFGYPADTPYGGGILYYRASLYGGADTEAGFTPVPMKIASDFTHGASGGPWVVETGIGPTVLSLNAYGYADQPGYLYGPYFGETAKKTYGLIAHKGTVAGIEESCLPLPTVTPPPTATVTPPGPGTGQTPTPETTAPPGSKTVTLQVTRVRRRANGSAVLMAKVSAAGQLNLSGAAVRAESVSTPAAGQYRMVVAAKGATNRRLRQVGKAKVGVSVAFSASGKTERVTKKIALSRPAVARAAQQRAAAQSR
jgi:hypothetical protein